MSLTNEIVAKCNRRLLLSRMRVLMNHGFYGLLLMHMKFALDETMPTAATDGVRIYFSPAFMDELSDEELDFVLMHEILHVALCHCFRGKDKDNNLFNIACDIVVNSNILYSNNMNLKSITIENFGESMHITPKGDEGYKYTAEEVYNMLEIEINKQGNKSGSGNNSKSSNKNSNSNSTSNSNSNNMSTSNSSSSKGDKGRRKRNNGSAGSELNDDFSNSWDSHDKWSTLGEDKTLKDVWVKRVVDAASSIYITESSSNRGTVPMFAKRIVGDFVNPQTDWRLLLDEFISEEVCDYSFNPPDKRFEDSPFYLPDFNDTDIEISDILFMVDTSASVNDMMIQSAYSEIKGAIDQYDGKLKGWLGFFDYGVVEPIAFENVDELKRIDAYGGGGTSFHAVFEYVNDCLEEFTPKTIIILTDGYAPFPDIEITKGIPVLWLINNDIVTPPWGKVARIKMD